MRGIKYYDVIRWLLRKGTIDDPYVPKTEEITVINNRAVLNEVPDSFRHVRIDGLVEIDEVVFKEQKEILPGQFLVNYQNGVIHFNREQEGMTFTVEYYGRGIIQYPAERVFVHSPNPWLVDNLQEFVDYIIEKTKEFNEFLQTKYNEFIQLISNKYNEFVQLVTDKYNEFVNKADLKIKEVDKAIDDASIATDQAKLAAYLAQEKGLYAEEQGNRIETLIDRNKILFLEVNEVKEDAINATEAALEARDLAIDARNRSILIWQSPVDTYDDLLSHYPNPEVGWTVLIQNSGVVYRYDGTYWRPIGNLTLSVPLASESIDGLMSAVDYIKLKGIEPNAQVNYVGEDAKEVLPDYFKTKTIVFVVPDVIQTGTQNIIIKFPYNGVIVDCSASLEVEGTDDTIIDIEKISIDDFKNKLSWKSILSSPLKIGYGDKTDDGSYEIIDTEKIVNQNDYFRINIKKAGIGAANLLVEIKIMI